MSLSANFGVYILNSFINDYIGSITLSYGLVLSICICIYLYRFMRLIQKKLSMTIYVSIALSILFLLFHFWAFKHAGSNNDYFFRAHDAACYFYYVIPNILGASLVFYFVETERYSFACYKSKVFSGLMLVFLYFLIFSNLFPSIILASFFSFVVINYFFAKFKTKTVIKQLKQIQIPLLGLLMWGVSLVFEWKGARASSEDLSYDFDLIGTIKGLVLAIIHKSNLWFLLFSVVVFILAIIILVINRKKTQNKQFFSFLWMCVYCIIITAVFNVLMCAKVASFYIKRTDILFTTYVFGFVLLCVLLCLFVTKPVIKMIMPLFLIVVCSISFSSGHRAFMESNIPNLDPYKCKQIDEYLIDQIKDAEADGSTEVTLHVPVFNSDNNWPLPEYGVQWIADTLYKQHVINTEMTVHYYPDQDVNKMFCMKPPCEF